VGKASGGRGSGGLLVLLAVVGAIAVAGAGVVAWAHN
jgi:hypothetical protein